jgi:GPH family glycoside/pentoside/hexuronide:cation symporter/glucuronide carrier protein
MSGQAATPATAPATTRIGRREKAAFFLANFSNIPVMSLIGSYLLIFYTDVVGLDPGAVATLFLLSRVLDGVNDPLMGYVVDHLPRRPTGRFRPFLALGAVVCSLNFLLLWLGPALMPVGKLVIAYASYVLIGITFDLMDIPLNSLIPAMTDDAGERNSLSAIKGFAYLSCSMLVVIGAPIVISAVKVPFTAYLILVLVATAIVAVGSTIGAAGVRERVAPADPDRKYPFRKVFPMLLLAPVLVTFVAVFVYSVGSTMMNAMLVYFAKYVLDNRIDVLSLAGAASFVGMLIALALSPRIATRFGKRIAFGCGVLLFGIGLLLRLFSVTSIPWLYVCAFVIGLGIGLSMSLQYGVQADNVDFVDWKMGIRAEGALASFLSFVAKAASGFGGAIPGYLLASAGYIANQAQTQTAKDAIILGSTVAPALLGLIGGALFLAAYPLDNRKMKDIEGELARRRAETTV